MVFKLVQKQKRYIDLKILSENCDKMYCCWPIFQNFTKQYFFLPKRGILVPKKGWGQEMGYFITFTTKMVKKGKRGTIFLNFCAILDFDIFRRFWTKIQIYPFWYLFYPFFGGGKKYHIFAISSTNISEIGKIAKKVQDIEILTHKKR